MSQSEVNPPELPKYVRSQLRFGGGAVGVFVVLAIIWSITAQITTTVRLPGVLSPEAPTHEVQHESGGRIADLKVKIHQEVRAGDVLMVLDMADERVQLDALVVRAATLEAELAAIAPRLDASLPAVDDLPEAVKLAYDAQDARFETQIAQLTAEEEAISRRVTFLAARHIAEDRLLELTRIRFDRGAELAEKGLLPARDLEELEQELHSGEASILALDAEEVELAQRQRDIALTQRRITQERLENLAAVRLRNERDLVDTHARIARLEEQIANARIVAPVSGKVTDMAVSTRGQVAPPGLTLLTISQPQDDPIIDLYVAPNYIDQVRVGQEGLLTVTSLSQRTAPKLRVKLTELAREPVKDAEGNSAHYLARGVINSDDLREAANDLGPRFQLSVGMPVSAAMNGRETTLWEFVTGPFTGLLGTAFED